MEAPYRMLEHRLSTVTEWDMSLFGVVDLEAGPGVAVDLVLAAVEVSVLAAVEAAGAGDVYL